MAVHVDELHTDVMPSASTGAQTPAASEHEPLGAAQERWQDARCLAERLTARTRAEGFDD